MSEKTIFKLFERLMKYLNLEYKLSIYDSTIEDEPLRYTVQFITKDKSNTLILRNNLTKYRTVPTVSDFIMDKKPFEEHIISEFLKHLITGRFEFIFQKNDLPDDLLSPMRISSFKLPESLEQLEILLTVSGY